MCSYLSECSLLNSPLNPPGKLLIVRMHQFGCDDGSGNVAGGVDDLLHPRHALGDVHGGHAREVERLQSHLCARFSYALLVNM